MRYAGNDVQRGKVGQKLAVRSITAQTIVKMNLQNTSTEADHSVNQIHVARERGDGHTTNSGTEGKGFVGAGPVLETPKLHPNHMKQHCPCDLLPLQVDFPFPRTLLLVSLLSILNSWVAKCATRSTCPFATSNTQWSTGTTLTVGFCQALSERGIAMHFGGGRWRRGVGRPRLKGVGVFNISSDDPQTFRRCRAHANPAFQFSSTIEILWTSPSIWAVTMCSTVDLHGVLTRTRALSSRCMSSKSSSTSTKSPTAATILRKLSILHATKGIPQHCTQISLLPGLVFEFHFSKP
ncbi:hypothetical protein GmHk_10G028548 [Glycine max]|nr:hypothetical protein GmHk_10G028548 [Glycine max]